MTSPWLVWQLIDSSFPTGGFAHSFGLEAAKHLGQVKSHQQTVDFIHESMWQLGFSCLPMVRAAHLEQYPLLYLDTLQHAWLSNHVANQASQSQGRSFLGACHRIFPHPEVATWTQQLRSKQLRAHLSPIFGACLRLLGLNCEETLRIFLFTSLRNLFSAALRLDLMSTYQSQRELHLFTPTLDTIYHECHALSLEQLCQPNPMLDLFSSFHSHLPARLFQS
jgi:urease accessory protein